MMKAVSFAVLAGGILLLVLGINAYYFSSSDISRFSTGSATYKAILMFVVGVVGTAIGSAGLLRGSKTV